MTAEDIVLKRYTSARPAPTRQGGRGGGGSVGQPAAAAQPRPAGGGRPTVIPAATNGRAHAAPYPQAVPLRSPERRGVAGTGTRQVHGGPAPSVAVRQPPTAVAATHRPVPFRPAPQPAPQGGSGAQGVGRNGNEQRQQIQQQQQQQQQQGSAAAPERGPPPPQPQPQRPAASGAPSAQINRPVPFRRRSTTPPRAHTPAGAGAVPQQGQDAAAGCVSVNASTSTSTSMAGVKRKAPSRSRSPPAAAKGAGRSPPRKIPAGPPPPGGARPLRLSRSPARVSPERALSTDLRLPMRPRRGGATHDAVDDPARAVVFQSISPTGSQTSLSDDLLARGGSTPTSSRSRSPVKPQQAPRRVVSPPPSTGASTAAPPRPVPFNDAAAARSAQRSPTTSAPAPTTGRTTSARPVPLAGGTTTTNTSTTTLFYGIRDDSGVQGGQTDGKVRRTRSPQTARPAAPNRPVPFEGGGARGHDGGAKAPAPAASDASNTADAQRRATLDTWRPGNSLCGGGAPARTADASSTCVGGTRGPGDDGHKRSRSPQTARPAAANRPIPFDGGANGGAVQNRVVPDRDGNRDRSLSAGAANNKHNTTTTTEVQKSRSPPAGPNRPVPFEPGVDGRDKTSTDASTEAAASDDASRGRSGPPPDLLPPQFAFPTQDAAADAAADCEMWDEDMGFFEEPLPPPHPAASISPEGPQARGNANVTSPDIAHPPRTRVPAPPPASNALDAAHIARMTEVFRASAGLHVGDAGSGNPPAPAPRAAAGRALFHPPQPQPQQQPQPQPSLTTPQPTARPPSPIPGAAAPPPPARPAPFPSTVPRTTSAAGGAPSAPPPPPPGAAADSHTPAAVGAGAAVHAPLNISPTKPAAAAAAAAAPAGAPPAATAADATPPARSAFRPVAFEAAAAAAGPVAHQPPAHATHSARPAARPVPFCGAGGGSGDGDPRAASAPVPRPVPFEPVAGAAPVQAPSAAGSTESNKLTTTATADDLPDPLAGFPEGVAGVFRRRGIKQFYKWQKEVLAMQSVRDGGNLVFSLPTSGGKSLVAEVLLLRAVCRRRSGILVMPYVALVDEKVAALEGFAKPLGIEVLASAGLTTQVPQPGRGFLCICTIEKANALVNLMIAENRLEELGCVVVDELHMVGEEGRGATLELLLTKLQRVHPTCQVVGMSATIPNLDLLATWLRAELYTSDFRPVSLRSFLCRSESGGTRVTTADGQIVRDLDTEKGDGDGVIALVNEVTPAHCVLVFCKTKKECEKVSRLLAEKATPAAKNAWPAEREMLIRDMKNVVAGSIDKALEGTLRAGVAYHHAGLTSEERILVEDAYRKKVVSVICCTSTLAAGVNLPARRVIIRHPYTGPTFLTKSRYLQMCGRAGRAGLDDCGESYLIALPRDVHKSVQLMEQAIEELKSQSCGADAVERVLTDVIATGVATTSDALNGFIGAMLYSQQALAQGDTAVAALETLFNHKLQELAETKIIKITDVGGGGGAPASGASNDTPNVAADSIKDTHNDSGTANAAAAARPGATDAEGNTAKTDAQRGGGSPLTGDAQFSCTPFGLSVFKSGFSASDARRLKGELVELQMNGLILSHDLHMLYYLTPIKDIFSLKLDWQACAKCFDRLSAYKKRIAAHIGVCEPYLAQKAALESGAKANPRDKEEYICRRFFCALMLADLLQEVPVKQVAQRYSVEAGQIQNLQNSSAQFSHMMVGFTESMGWTSLQFTIQSYVKRLGCGVRADCAHLTEIRGVQAGRARCLFNAGYKTIAAIAKANPDDILQRVKKTASKGGRENPTAKYLHRGTIVQIVSDANVLLQQKIAEKRQELELLAESGT